MKTRKTTTIVISGGFHNSVDLRMRVQGTDIHPATDTLRELLSESQTVKASNHFCGIRGCTCGSIDRTTWDVEE